MGSVVVFFKEMNTNLYEYFYSAGMHSIDQKLKTLIMLQKINISDKCCSFELHQRSSNNPEK